MTMVKEHGFKRNAVCRALTVARSTSYAESEAQQTTDFDTLLGEEACKHPRAGSRMLSAYLKRRGLAHAGRTRVGTAMQRLGIIHTPKRRTVRTTNSRHGFERYPNLVLKRRAETTDEIWVADITYIRLEHGFVYLAVVIDMYTRIIRGWALEATMEQSLTLAALEMALQHHRPSIHHSDHSVQYAALAYTERLINAGVAISMASIGEPTENGYAERLMRTIKDEEVSLTEYADIDDARTHIGVFLTDVYNTKRPHSSLSYLTPEEFQALDSLAKPITFVN
jgi:putative transposase